MTGRNPFAGWQQENQARRVELLRTYLKSIRKTRVQLKYVTDLAEMAAEYIGEKEGKACDRATLLRNKKYKALLLSYMADNMAEGTDSINRDAIRDPAARALLSTADYSIENLTRENERLKSYIAELTGKLAKSEPTTKALPAPTVRGDRNVGAVEVSQDRLRYLSTCEALYSVLQKFKGIVHVDSSGDKIMDATESPPQVLVDVKTAKPFFEWFRNSGRK